MSIEEDLNCLGFSLTDNPIDIRAAVTLIDTIDKLSHFDVAILMTVSKVKHTRASIVNQKAVDRLISLSFIEEEYSDGRISDQRLIVTELGERVVDFLFRTTDD